MAAAAATEPPRASARTSSRNIRTPQVSHTRGAVSTGASTPALVAPPLPAAHDSDAAGRANATSMQKVHASLASPRAERFPTEAEMKQHSLIKDRVWMFKTWKQCFVANEVVAFMVANGFASSPKKAVELAQELVKQGEIFYLGV